MLFWFPWSTVENRHPMRTTPTANSKLWPELNLNRAEVTEWNRKLKLSFSHSRKEKGDVRRNQKAHVLHSKALVLGEHASLFLLPSTHSEERLNSPSQLPGTTGERYPFIFLPHTALTLPDALQSALQEQSNCRQALKCKRIKARPYSEFFYCIAPVPSPLPPQIRVWHKDRGDL